MIIHVRYWAIAWRFFVITIVTLGVILYTFKIGLERGYAFGFNDATRQCVKAGYTETIYEASLDTRYTGQRGRSH